MLCLFVAERHINSISAISDKNSWNKTEETALKWFEKDELLKKRFDTDKFNI